MIHHIKEIYNTPEEILISISIEFYMQLLFSKTKHGWELKQKPEVSQGKHTQLGMTM